MSRRYPLIHHEVDDGTVRADAYHVRDGFYSLTLSCRECPEATTEHPFIAKDRVLPIWRAWAQEHRHNP